MTDTETARRSTPVWAWPSSDRTAWARACEPARPFDTRRGRASIWKKTTRDGYARAYGGWLAWLEAQGELERNVSPDARATEERAHAFCLSLQADGLAPYTVAWTLAGMARVLAAMMPDLDFQWLSQAAWRLHNEARPIKDVTGCFRPIEDVENLANEMMWEAEHGRFRSPYENALLFRDGLLISLQVHRCLRVSNLANIHIGQQLQESHDGWRLTFAPAEMKTPRPFACPWPDVLHAALEHYLEVHRPVLIGDESMSRSGPLWVSRSGGGLTSTECGVRIRKWTGEAFGVPINPHAFRHLVATTIATDDPEQVWRAPVVLGHASSSATEEYYIKARQRDAAGRHQDVVAQMRRHGS